MKEYKIVWVGKASDVFDEIKKCAALEKYGIGWKVFTSTVINLN
jgi:hypothetical protein